MNVEVLQADITTLAVDAIVNAANSSLRGGGGVDGAIHRAAGPELLAACRRLDRCPTGQAVLTPGFQLPARFVIHAVGPVWEGGGCGEPELLRRTYQSAFEVARTEPTVRSIAFPAISTGAVRVPTRGGGPHRARGDAETGRRSSTGSSPRCSRPRTVSSTWPRSPRFPERRYFVAASARSRLAWKIGARCWSIIPSNCSTSLPFRP